jgi:hypothetical protein
MNLDQSGQLQKVAGWRHFSQQNWTKRRGPVTVPVDEDWNGEKTGARTVTQDDSAIIVVDEDLVTVVDRQLWFT